MSITAATLMAVVQVQGAQQAKSDLADVGKSSDSVSGGFGNMIKQGLATATSFAIFNVGAKAVGFLKDQMTDTISVAIAHQQVMSQTATAIQSTGGAAGMTADAIANLANSLSQVTPYSDDAIQSGENLLLTFKGIGKDTFPAATQAMLDMSTAMGGDTKSAAMQLGKALNDPVQGLSALQRVGVTFSDSQKEAIKQMVATGNTAGAQKIMLQELNSEFGGSAKAAGQTFGGQLQILQNKLMDAKQAIGGALLPILGQLVSSVSGMVLPAIQNFSKFMQSPAFQQFAKVIGDDIVGALQKVGSFIQTDVAPAIQKFASYLQSPGFQAFAKTMEKDVGNALGIVGGIIKQDIMPVVNSFIGVLKSPQFQQFAEMIGRLAGTYLAGLKNEFDLIKPIVEGLFGFIQNIALPALSGLGNGLSSVINWFNQGGPAAQLVEDALIGVGVAIGLIGIANFIGTLPGLFAGLTTWAVEQGAVALATLLTALPYIAIGALIAIVVIGIIEAIQHWGAIAHWLQGVWSAIAGFFVGLWNGIMGVFGAIGNWFHDRFTEAYNAIKNILGNLGPKALTWAQDMLNQFVQGILGGIGAVGDAVSKIAGKIAGFLHFSKPDVGPLTDVDNWMPDFGDILSKGLTDQVNKVQAPALKLASTMALNLNPLQGGLKQSLTSIPAGTNAIPAGAGNQGQDIYVQIPEITLDGASVVDKVMQRTVKGIRRNGPLRGSMQ